ncbi:hypothetical protein JMJ55_08180 [Belnapia sp. T6]|uniref:Pyridine nucleotide-disulphide oxidoreductase n=1 Tax=Belnapia mucosa TaxID=2804532 RepID=A0ABS1V0R3_9PROT|nr:hypothetical protein [Belnapia mucosa]MBL6455294.1 hypothetical protein [Belnapia mucosa]
MRAVIIGAGPAGRAAAALLPEARVVTRPAETAWHAEPGRIWIEGAAGVAAVEFSRLLLAADEPLLLMALGCRFEAGRPVVDEAGQTTRPGIFAAGAILGAADAEEAARQGAIAARALAGLPPDGRIAASPRPLPAAERLDPLAVAQLLEEEPGPDRSARALAQAELRGARLTSLVAPARPVGFAALAAMAPASLAPCGTQADEGVLG